VERADPAQAGLRLRAGDEMAQGAAIPGDCYLGGISLMASEGLFDVERDGEMLVIVPTADLRESAYEALDEGARGIFELLAGGDIGGIVVDFHRTDYYGSTALGFF